MAMKTQLIGTCPMHGEFFMDAIDSPCPACEDGEEQFETTIPPLSDANRARLQAEVREYYANEPEDNL